MLRTDIGSNHNIKALGYTYILEKLLNDWKIEHGKTKLLFKIHYPGQFFLGDDIFNYYLDETHYYLAVFINDLEILSTRNSKNRKCYEESANFDEMLLKEYLSNVNCSVPYISHGNMIPPCKSAGQMKISKLDILQADKLQMPKACKRISKMRISNKFKRRTDLKKSEKWSFYLYYPKEVKIITQSKEVDLHALIGNIGGYLGLFLGK